MEISINKESSLYVMKNNNGCFTHGFKNVFENACQLAKMLSEPVLEDRFFGTIEAWDEYRRLVSEAAKRNIQETWFDPGTADGVKVVLEDAIRQKTPIRFFHGDPEVGKDWLDTYDVVGYIGRSCGTLKTPILLPKRNSNEGGAILTACILKIIDRHCRVIYQHPAYIEPQLEICIRGAESSPKYPVSVLNDGQSVAGFQSEKQAQRWIDFMTGRRFRQ